MLKYFREPLYVVKKGKDQTKSKIVRILPRICKWNSGYLFLAHCQWESRRLCQSSVLLQYFLFSLNFSRSLSLGSGLWLLSSCLYDASRLSTRQRDASGILIAIYFCPVVSLVPLVASSRADRYKTDYDTAVGSILSML